MVARYPHTAVVYGPEGKEVDGEFVPQEAEKTSVKGRLSIKTVSMNVGIDHDRQTWRAKYYTTHPVINDAQRLEVNGRLFDIVDWIPRQTQSVILLR